jgi:hypothetical protein
MTVKELSNLFDVSAETVKRVIREMFPDKMENGKRTVLNEEECVKLGSEIRKKGYIQPTQNEQVPTQNEQVINQFTKALEIFSKTLDSIDKRLFNLENKQIENKTKQIEYIPEMTIRQRVVKNIREYSFKAYGNYFDGFNELYKNVYYRLHINLNCRAAEFNIKIIEYIENYLELSIQNKILFISEEMLKGNKL